MLQLQAPESQCIDSVAGREAPGMRDASNRSAQATLTSLARDSLRVALSDPLSRRVFAMQRSCSRVLLVAALAASVSAGACTRSNRESTSARNTATPEGAHGEAKSSDAQASLSDADIRAAVVDELFRSSHILGSSLVVGCKDGIVDLTGSVDNLLAKNRAVAVVESVRGVRVVSDRIRVTPVSRPDTEIIRDVRNALKYEPATSTYAVKVDAAGGIVHLTGAVDSWEERRLADRLAQSIRGVKRVQDDITVNVFKPRSDEEIRRDIESRLAWDTFVNNGLLKVDVKDGNARLSGTLGSAAEKTEAYRDAWVYGVRSVDSSQVQVKWWAKDEDLRKQKYTSKTDEQISSALRDALSRDPRLKAAKLDPKVVGGVVTLSGEVRSQKAKLAAESLARHTVGVNGIHDEIQVKASKPIDDKELAARIESSIAADPLLDAKSIQVAVADGKVTLSGQVPTLFESAETVDVADAVEGVKSVSNQLTVSAPEVAYVWTSQVFPDGPYVEEWHYTAAVPAQSDTEITRRIQQELERDPYVNPKRIHVTVHDGKARLTGTVDSWGEKRAAAENAFEAGAIAVDNQLHVG